MFPIFPKQLNVCFAQLKSLVYNVIHLYSVLHSENIDLS